MEMLKACPFCGNADVQINHGFSGTLQTYAVYCNASCYVRTQDFIQPELAIAAWNTRTTLDAPRLAAVAMSIGSINLFVRKAMLAGMEVDKDYFESSKNRYDAAFHAKANELASELAAALAACTATPPNEE